jgi:hypothetical protein
MLTSYGRQTLKAQEQEESRDYRSSDSHSTAYAIMDSSLQVEVQC